ncbi:unnamed protein product [Plutella xylostella]|uniref:(diamondback moth) hypothetical protein n=1 Tax=Plutella xylostella TaxID=51655 RepID=A0A8S4EV45_PLUXY|nr:unnamed protein product [Plutella xylostella]
MLLALTRDFVPQSSRQLHPNSPTSSGSDAEPVWKLQDPGCDQGYGSERSPEEDCAPALPPAPVSLEEYEAQLRAVYPFIDDRECFVYFGGLGLDDTGTASQ